MSTLEAAESAEPAASKGAWPRSDLLVRAAPHVVVWTLLLVPTIRTMARGWRPSSDDASIAIWAWRSLSLHPPLVGQLTGGSAAPNAGNPGPLEFWLLSPFAHLDPGQGVLLGSAILCALILSVAIYVLGKTARPWAPVVFSLTVVVLALTSPTPFVDPVWNSSFGLFWFVAFLGVAFAVGLGNLRYFPLLLFIGSVAVDSHLLYLPSIAILLVAVGVCGWFTRRPADRRWLWWTGAVAVFCWAAPVCQQLFGARGNLSLLLQSSGIPRFGSSQPTEGLTVGLRALSRAASLHPIWTSPRPIYPYPSTNDIAHGNLAMLLVVPVLVGVAVVAWRHKSRAVFSMCVITLGSALGTVFLFSHTPVNYFLSFTWLNLAVWVLGICIWLTLGLAVVTALRSRYAADLARHVSASVQRIAIVSALAVACVAGTLVAVFPYGNQFILDWGGVARVKAMTAAVQGHVPRGDVSMGIVYSGDNVFEPSSEEHGVAYLLLTGGWRPGLEAPINQNLGMPINTKSPFVIFTQRGQQLTDAQFYPRYQYLWFLTHH